MQFSTVSTIKDLKSFCSKNLKDEPPFINFDFFYYLEITNCTGKNAGWVPEHIIIKENNSIIGVIPNFRKFNSYGEYVFDQIFENAHHQLGFEYYPKYLSAIPFTPVTRKRFFYNNEKNIPQEIYGKLIKFLKKKQVSSFHINFINKKISDELKKNNFLQRIGIQYHWKNRCYKEFDDFLSDLKARKKKNILKERNYLKKKKIKISIKTGKKIEANDIFLLFECYKNTINKKWSYKYLSLKFFKKLFLSSLLEKMVLILAFDDQGFVGCSLHFIGKGTLYGRYWGCLREIPFLHFELCYYQAIEYAIQNKLKIVEAGAQGEHKISRGYLPNLTFSNHWFSHSFLNEKIKTFLKMEEKKIKENLDFLKKHSPFSD